MTELDLSFQVDGDPAVDCDNCDWTGVVSQLESIKDAQERLDPGCPVPAGECPECSALAYLTTPPSHLPKVLNRVLLDRYLSRAHLYYSHIPVPASKGGPAADIHEEASRSFQRGLAVGTIKVLELILEDHGLPVPLSPDVDQAFQDLLAALRADELLQPTTPGSKQPPEGS